MARHARFSKLGSQTGWLKHKSKILLHSHKETNVSEGILNAYVSYLFCWHISGLRLLRAQFLRRALHYMSVREVGTKFYNRPEETKFDHDEKNVFIYLFIYFFNWQSTGFGPHWSQLYRLRKKKGQGLCNEGKTFKLFRKGKSKSNGYQIQTQQRFPLFTEGRFTGENMNDLKDLKMKVGMGLAEDSKQVCTERWGTKTKYCTKELLRESGMSRSSNSRWV